MHLDITHWNNLDAKYKKWAEYNSNPKSMWQRAELVKRFVKLIITELLPKVTERQREIVILYFKKGLKQKQIAGILGISQPTVSQHLFGKKRNGKIIGGSIPRMRKLLEKFCKESNQPSIFQDLFDGKMHFSDKKFLVKSLKLTKLRGFLKIFKKNT